MASNRLSLLIISAFSACHERGAAPMVKVSAGAFEMGCREQCSDSGNDRPAHRVELSAFEIDRTEVTQAAYASCVAAKACTTPTGNFEPIARAEFPVTNVSWAQAAAYCAWGKKRLPTEAEWERAARGTDGRRYPWGSDAPTCARGNFAPCGGKVARVGSAPAGASVEGVLDLAGNVEEWVNDFHAVAYYASSPARDPRGPEQDHGSGHAVRGGSYLYDAWHIGASVRMTDPGAPADDLGFRCAR
jgi:formylglycine-generating enzyme required for sulfatase activity